MAVDAYGEHFRGERAQALEEELNKLRAIPQLTAQEYRNLIWYLQDLVDDEHDNPDVQEWQPLLDKLYAQAKELYNLSCTCTRPERNYGRHDSACTIHRGMQ